MGVLASPIEPNQRTSGTHQAGNDQIDAKQLIREHFRFFEDIPSWRVAPGLSENSGFFRFNGDTVCFGQCSSGLPAASVAEALHSASAAIKIDGTSLDLPLDPVQIVDNLRHERYMLGLSGSKRGLGLYPGLRNIYYFLRPLIPTIMRKHLQRVYFSGWDEASFPKWPVDSTVENIFEQLLVVAMKSQGRAKIPFIWFWPEGAPSCAIMTHDVETARGLDFCGKLMDLNESLGIEASFQIIPEKRYKISSDFVAEIRKRGFEVNIHDLNHDCRLFNERTEFLRRAERIKEHQRQFNAEGFRSAVLYRNADWYDALDFSYDMSIPNVAHLDPQRGGCCTVLPFFIGKTLELPVTTTQDYTLFHILGDYSTRLWRQQAALIQAKHGLMSFIVHPDYIIPDRARAVYRELLAFLAELRSQRKLWLALPKDVAKWWRMRSGMRLVNEGGGWRIEGEGSERAKVAYAILADDRIAYEIDPVS
jgi:hypothetical protein